MANMRQYLCSLCGMGFANPMQLGPHVRVCSRTNNVIRFAEFDDTFELDVIPDTTQTQLTTAVPAPQNVTLQTPQLLTPQVPEQTQLPTQINKLCTRTGGGPRSVVEDSPMPRSPNVVPNPLLTIDFCPLQRAWNEYVQHVYHMCDPDYWEMFETVLFQSTKCVDHVLSSCLDLLVKKNATVIKYWPRSKRTLRDLITRNLGNFWSGVTIKKSIDVRSFNIPGAHLPTLRLTHVLPTPHLIQVHTHM